MLKMLEKAKSLLAMLLCIISLCMPALGRAIPFNQISQVYFFGDSLTDSGFNNNMTAAAGLPNKAPTFTTYGGYTWSQYIAHDIKGYPLPTGPFPTTSDKITNNTTPLLLPSEGAVTPDLTGIDYACGGSRTGADPGDDITWAPSLKQQIRYFLKTSPKVLDPQAIYFVWSGANDLLILLTQNPAPNQFQLLQTADIAAINIASQIAALSARGAKKIVVMALPSLGAAPFAYQTAVLTNTPTVPATLKTLSYLFNTMLNRRVGEALTRLGSGPHISYPTAYTQIMTIPYKEMQVLFFDTYNFVNDVITTSRWGLPYTIRNQSFFFANTTDPVCGLGVSSLYCTQTSNQYFFADAVHPTDLAHRALSLAVENSIAAL